MIIKLTTELDFVLCEVSACVPGDKHCEPCTDPDDACSQLGDPADAGSPLRGGRVE